MLESTGEIDRVLSELHPANPAANDSRLVEKVLMRSREVKLKNFQSTYGMPEEPQLFLGDGNVLAEQSRKNIRISRGRVGRHRIL